MWICGSTILVKKGNFYDFFEREQSSYCKHILKIFLCNRIPIILIPRTLQVILSFQEN